MRIAIDATSVPPRPAGAGVYALELVRALAADDRRNGYALFTRTRLLDEDLRGRKNWHIEHVAGGRGQRLAWEQARLPGRLDALRIDVLHSTHHTLPLRPVRARRVVTLHDVTFFRLPDRYPPLRRLYFRAVTSLSARAADAVIAPSEAARADIMGVLGLPAAKVHAVYEAAGEAYRLLPREEAAAVAARYGLDGSYILSVGSLEPGKNRARLIRAFAALRGRGLADGLAIIGQPAWRYEEDFALVKELGMRDHVRFLGYVPAQDLPALYNAAAVFAFPSLFEGFGLPVLEAMACGTPVLTSNISATAEVAGDAALLVDPVDTEAIAGGLARLLADPLLRQHHATRGLERAALFSWQRAARETRAVYEQAASGLPGPPPAGPGHARA